MPSFSFVFFPALSHPRCKALTLAATWMHPEDTMFSERYQTQKETGCYPTEGKRPEQIDPQSQSGFLVVRSGEGRE